MAIQVDLNVRLLPDQPRAFLARPGARTCYFDSFRKMKAIGPDFPFLELQKRINIDKQPDLMPILRRAQAFRSWRNSSPHSDPPSQNLLHYRSRPRISRNTAAQFRVILQGYFEKARKGDLVLIPSSAWRDDSLLVEFSTSRHKHKTIALPYTNDHSVNILARPFKELTTIPKRLLPHHILDVVTKPNAFARFNDFDTLKLHELAYHSFVRNDEYSSTFHVTNQDYSLNADMQFGIFVKFISANMQALSDKRGNPYSINEAITGNFGDFVPSLQSNVNSPGQLRLTSVRRVPLIASAILHLLIQFGREAIEFIKNNRISVISSITSGKDRRISQVEQDVIDLLMLLELSDDVAKLSELVRALHEETGLHSKVNITKK